MPARLSTLPIRAPPRCALCRHTSTAPSAPPPIPKPAANARKLPKLLRRVPHRPSAPPSPPPLSPLLNPQIYLPYWKRHPKPAAPAPARSSSLHVNPYAQILLSPPRQDIDHGLRLPGALLMRFRLKRRAETGEVWVLPEEQGGAGMYTLGTKRVVAEKVGKKKEVARLVPAGMRQKVLGSKKGVVYREDMDGFVEERMRRAVAGVVGRGMWSWGRDFRAEGEGGEKEGGESAMVGCVLDFRRDHKIERALVRAGKTVPCHGMWEMLGDEVGQEVQEKLRVEENAKDGMVDVLMTVRTRLLQVELMRLRAYYELYFIPSQE